MGDMVIITWLVSILDYQPGSPDLLYLSTFLFPMWNQTWSWWRASVLAVTKLLQHLESHKVTANKISHVRVNENPGPAREWTGHYCTSIWNPWVSEIVHSSPTLGSIMKKNMLSTTFVGTNIQLNLSIEGHEFIPFFSSVSCCYHLVYNHGDYAGFAANINMFWGFLLPSSGT